MSYQTKTLTEVQWVIVRDAISQAIGENLSVDEHGDPLNYTRAKEQESVLKLLNEQTKCQTLKT